MTNQIQKQNAPNAVAALVLGICSIVLALCMIIIVFIISWPLALACGIVGLVLSIKGLMVCNGAPDMYQGMGKLQAGKILSIIGIGLCVVVPVLVSLVCLFL